MTNQDILKIAMEQSAYDCNCQPEDFLSYENKVVLSKANDKARAYLPLPFEFDITDFVNPNFLVIKKHFETKFQLSFDTDGGNILENKEVVLGKPYGELPIPTKT